MPHLHLEYSNNLSIEPKQVLVSLNRALLDGAYVNQAQDIKSRAICQEQYVVGIEIDSPDAFAHVKLSLLSGRSEALKAEISQTLLNVLEHTIAKPAHLNLQLCVEMAEMSKTCYRKVVLAAE